uniref:(northern house mosquito) hypothetical protein n=1 Tax=Culex pipiens TaxID=7175 RepID=A0A8D8FVX0_CULPI
MCRSTMTLLSWSRRRRRTATLCPGVERRTLPRSTRISASLTLSRRRFRPRSTNRWRPRLSSKRKRSPRKIPLRMISMISRSLPNFPPVLAPVSLNQLPRRKLPLKMRMTTMTISASSATLSSRKWWLRR